MPNPNPLSRIDSFKLRLKCCWNVLRGRPTMYRVTVESSGLIFPEPSHMIVGECEMKWGEPKRPTISFDDVPRNMGISWAR